MAIHTTTPAATATQNVAVAGCTPRRRPPDHTFAPTATHHPPEPPSGRRGLRFCCATRAAQRARSSRRSGDSDPGDVAPVVVSCDGAHEESNGGGELGEQRGSLAV